MISTVVVIPARVAAMTKEGGRESIFVFGEETAATAAVKETQQHTTTASPARLEQRVSEVQIDR